MKRVSIFLAMALAVCMVATSSCKKDKDKDEVPSLSINPSQTEVKFKADGSADGNATFTVSTNQTSWNAVSDQTWVTVSKTATGFTLSAATNTSYTDTPEAATVTVSATGVTPVVLNVTQSAKSPPEDGVLINGVVWAKHNVDAPVTFAATPEAFGMFYQWNRKVAWAATGTVSNWDDTYPEGDSWLSDNDPSPEGWRVPTREELNSLFAATKVSSVWTTQNSVIGQLFTDKATNATLFLPAAKYRQFSDGMLSITVANGDYWSSTANGTKNAYALDFGSRYAVVLYDNCRYGFSVRSVAK